MLRFFTRRLVSMVFVLFSISVLSFLIFFATPGVDPAARIAGKNADQATLLAVRKDFGLDKPLPVRYAVMMKKLFVSRDLTSYVNRGAEVIPQVVEAQEEDYVRTARAKGLTERRVLMRHALRTSLVAFVSLFGLDFGALVGGGALLTEVVFGLHGVGKLTYDSLQNLDLPVILATVIYAAFFVVLANALVDLVYAWLDPRVRRGLALAGGG